MTQEVMDRIDANREADLEALKEYLRIPSISTDPAYSDDVYRCSEYVAGQMREAGLVVRTISGDDVGTGGYPLVLGEWNGAEGAPTVLFYGHYDVQPPDPLDEWRNAPFEPTVEGDLLVARGATDDKGQSLTHLKAIQAVLSARGDLPVNVKVLVEGEEESGGETIEHFVRADAGRVLGADCVVISDTSMFGPNQPSLLYGLKGLLYTELTVQGPNRDLHSGTFGGAVNNPLNALCAIVAALKDPASGKINIPGFYDDVRALEAWERDEFGKLPFDEAAYAAELGVEQVFGEQGYSTLERAWARPTCDVNGMWGGYQGPGAKTVLPARAGAKVSMRLVPDQDPDKIAASLSKLVAELSPPGVEAKLEVLSSGQAVLVDVAGPYAEAAMAAYLDVWGTSPVKVREGGSIPIVATFAEVLEAPVLLMGFGLPDDRLHSPNEKFNISHYDRGIRTIAQLLDRIAEQSSGSVET